MSSVKTDLQREIEHFFGIQKNEIKEFKKLRGSNSVYSFIVGKQKFVIKKLIETTIVNWEQEKAAYNSLKSLKITDKLVYYNNGIKITEFFSNSKELSNSKPDMVEALEVIREVHESGVSINYDYNIIENMDKYISHCNKKSKRLAELKKYRETINTIQTILDKLNIPKVLCHGDACTPNILRLPDKSIKIIDWEQAGMADPLLDIAIASLHQGFEKADPVWCLHHYLKRIPKKQEYLRLFSFLALDSFALAAWCIYGNQGDYKDCLELAVKYSELVLNYYKDIG